MPSYNQVKKAHPNWREANLLYVASAPDNFESSVREVLLETPCVTCRMETGLHLFNLKTDRFICPPKEATNASL